MLVKSLNICDVEQVLNEKVRPGLRKHGGDVQVVGFENGCLKIRMQGQCKNCPSAMVESEQMLEEHLRPEFPQIKRCVLLTGVSDDLIAQARAMLKL